MTVLPLQFIIQRILDWGQFAGKINLVTGFHLDRVLVPQPTSISPLPSAIGLGNMTRFHLTFHELREQRCQSSNRGGKVPIPKSPHYNFFFTETANTFNLRSEKWTNHWRLKLWSLLPSSQCRQENHILEHSNMMGN